MSFQDLALPAELLRNVERLGFTNPTPIQTAAIPPALAGRDLVGCAQTGSGKTAAFGLPLIARLAGAPKRGTRALILTPTRELAVQVAEHLSALAAGTGLRVAAIFGGVPAPRQERDLRSGVDIVVATPGRLGDHIQSGVAKLDGVEVLVLDEADRMLDMGFLPVVRQILRRLPAKRQTLFFSATMPKPIVVLANEMLHDPVSIGIAREPHSVKLLSQQLYPVPAELKSALVVGLLESDVVSRAIVFTRTKHRANRLADYLVKRGISTERIHGNRSQAQRTQALEGFKAGRYRVLVATDIAARGIDIAALGHVVNFDVPLAPEDYVHRIGRTARAERSGAALTLVAPDEEQLVRAIERTTGSRIERVTLPGFDYKNVPAERLEIPLAQRLAVMRANRRPKSAAPRRRDTDRRFSPS